MNFRIRSLSAREIVSSSGYPTIEVQVVLTNGISSRASVPYGASAGTFEAATLWDGGRRFGGRGMLRGVRTVHQRISPALRGTDVRKQRTIDAKLRSLDSTPQKTKLGGNTLLAVSLACARTAAEALNIPLYRYLRESFHLLLRRYILPSPLMVMIEGGKHASDSTDVQEYLIAPVGKKTVADKVRAGIEIYYTVGMMLSQKGFSTNVGSEGAFAPSGIRSNEEPLQLLTSASKKAGYTIGSDILLAVDGAASELFYRGKYVLKKQNKHLAAHELIQLWQSWAKKYHLGALEDGLSEDDWGHWDELYRSLHTLPEKPLLVGDDLTVTNYHRLHKAIDLGVIDALIIKPNQVGTLSDTMDTVRLALQHGIQMIVSHRGGGETADTFISDLAVAINARFLKVGPTRGERTEKYNRLLEIEAELQAKR